MKTIVVFEREQLYRPSGDTFWPVWQNASPEGRQTPSRSKTSAVFGYTRCRSKTSTLFAPLRTPSAKMARLGPQRGPRAALARRRLPFSKRSALVQRRLSFSPLGGRLLPIARFRSFSSMLLGGLCDQIVIIIVIRLVKVFSSRFTQGGGGSCRRHWKSAAPSWGSACGEWLGRIGVLG